MTINDIVIGQRATLSVHDDTSSVERDVTVVERSVTNPYVFIVTAVHELNEDNEKALVIFDYGKTALNAKMADGFYTVPVDDIKVVKKRDQTFYMVFLHSEEMTIYNRRAYKRFPVMADVEIGVHGHEQNPIHGYLKDVCYAGLCFSLTDECSQLQVGVQIHITIKHKDTPIPLSVTGYIMNTHTDELEDNRIRIYYGVSLATEYEQIRGLVNRVERKELQMLKRDVPMHG